MLWVGDPLEVVTVDACQGSEAPHIILSTVRSNSGANIGFAENPRRLNVAISRAQESLTIVGNRDVFWRSKPNWCRVVEAFGRTGQVTDVPVDVLELKPSWALAERQASQMAERRGSKGKGKGKGTGNGNFHGCSAGLHFCFPCFLEASSRLHALCAPRS